MMTIPPKWINLMRRILGLQPGEWVIILKIREDGCSYQVAELGKVESKQAHRTPTAG